MAPTMYRRSRAAQTFWWRWLIPALFCLGLAIGTNPTASAATVTYSYNGNNQIQQISYDNGIVVNFLYDANGNRTSVTVLTPGLETPTNLTATAVSDTEINLSFTGSPGATGYYVQRCAGAGCSTFSRIGTATTASYSDNGLTPATTYVYRVQAYDASNTSAVSSTASAETAADTTPPTVPTGLTATAQTYSTVSLTWNAATDPEGVAGYHVYRNGSEIATIPGTSYTDGGLSPSTTYSYTVSAYDSYGNTSAQSGTASATTPAIQPPSAPTGLAASAAANTQINLSWTASADGGGPGIAGYKVYRNGSLIGSTAATTYSDTGVAVFSTYSYTVAAYDVDGNVSAQSAAVSGSTYYQITSSTGTILSSASSMYSVTSRFEAGPMGAQDGFYVWYVTETVGSDVTAVNVNGPTGGTSPACADGTVTQITSGYQLSGCVLIAEPSVYGH